MWKTNLKITRIHICISWQSSVCIILALITFCKDHHPSCVLKRSATILHQLISQGRAKKNILHMPAWMDCCKRTSYIKFIQEFNLLAICKSLAQSSGNAQYILKQKLKIITANAGSIVCCTSHTPGSCVSSLHAYVEVSRKKNELEIECWSSGGICKEDIEP
jgi:hypothetical protein